MKKLLVLFTVLWVSQITPAQNPFAAYGYEVKTATMSNGEYDENHDMTDVVEIGSFRFDTRKNEIVGIIERDTTKQYLAPEVISRFVSMDPHAERYYSISPYAYCANNPVRFIDPDGRKIVDAQGKIMYQDGKWLSNATEGARLIADNMQLTNVGKEAFNNLANANYEVQLIYDQTSDIGKVGETIREYNATGETTKATITVFEKNIVSELSALTEIKSNGGKVVNPTESQTAMLKLGIPNKNERIGQVGSHESEHVTNPAAWKSKGGDYESVAGKAELKVIKENYIKRPLPMPKLDIPEMKSNSKNL